MRFRGLKILLLAVTAAAVLFLLCGAVKTLGMDRWVDFDVYRITGCDRTSIIYDGQSDVVSRLHGVQDRTWVSVSELQPSTVYAFISAEDARFFEHEGVDVIRIAGAIVADIKAGSYVQGASTISQQLIKLSHLTSEKTISRKAEEAALAYEMERQYSKEDILEMYLNYVYFGGGYRGGSRGLFRGTRIRPYSGSERHACRDTQVPVGLRATYKLCGFNKQTQQYTQAYAGLRLYNRR